MGSFRCRRGGGRRGGARRAGFSRSTTCRISAGSRLSKFPTWERQKRWPLPTVARQSMPCQDAAWKILREGGKYEEAKQRQIESLCDSGNITFNLAGNRLSITYSDGQYSYKSTLEKDEYDEWSVELFDENEALKMLGIADDDDMISYLIDCIGVDENEKNN